MKTMPKSTPKPRLQLAMCTALAATLPAAPLHAQQMDHSMHGTAPASKPSDATRPAPATSPPARDAVSSTPMQGMDHAAMDHSKMDHSGMQHGQAQRTPPAEVDHSSMDHSSMDHAKIDQGIAELPANAPPREPIPSASAEARAAAFPRVHAHHLHGTRIENYSLIDRLEISDAEHGSDLAWEAGGWIGGDIRKFQWRSEGHARDGKIERADIEALYNRGIRAWWDVVAGARHDFGHGPNRSWAAIGVQGFTPYKFEVAVTAYLGPGGRSALRAEAEYDTLLSNRWILQWRAEAEAYGKDDAALGIGSGLSTLEAGMRLRYEINRQFAPYIGIEHERAFGRSADFRRAAGEDAGDTRVVAGVRIWF